MKQEKSQVVKARRIFFGCKDRGRQFIGNHETTRRGRLSGIAGLVKITLVRGVGIRDVAPY
ncbi:MAG: hypothetical protein LBK73_01510 [Treponema sp.]|jgi:hypothetical protein|nr:hypothetical protein [Treponema sp.]